MRIAILVYGRLDKCKIHYKNIMETFGYENQIDFFASSDDSPYINDFVELYMPVAYTNEKTNYQIDFASFPGKCPETNIHTMTCHFINKLRVFYLMEEHASRMKIQYDLIVSLRVDLLFHTKLINIEIEDNTIYIPHGYDAYVNAINDQVAIGSFPVMKIYNNIFNNSIKFLEKGLSIPHPETLTFFNLLYNNIKVVRIPLAYSIDKW
jgi:hypothetical protein